MDRLNTSIIVEMERRLVAATLSGDVRAVVLRAQLERELDIAQIKNRNRWVTARASS